MKQDFFQIDAEISALGEKAMDVCRDAFKRIEEITEYNQQKVLHAFIKNGVSEAHLVESTGYGYDDRGRDVLDAVFADALGAESALVRHSFASGTHTLAVALFGILRPGDTMLCVTGDPYDTIHDVIGISGENMGSLKEFGVTYSQVDLKDGTPDLSAIQAAVKAENNLKLVYIQRSRGYSLRPTLSVEEIGEIVSVVRAENKDTIIFVDNCYGEFTQKTEPVSVGADLMAGSLIKNAGGGIARSGGYIAGRRDLVELCAYRHTTPGTGREIGATLGQNRNLFMGFFQSPHVTGEAIKTAVFCAAVYEQLGYEVSPTSAEPRYDIIQSVKLGTPEGMIAFCKGMQAGAPVDSFVTPEPWDMPGYDDKVIMAAGAFIGGASIELSADGPMREPYAVWMQGGLNFHSGKLGVLLAVQEMKRQGALK